MGGQQLRTPIERDALVEKCAAPRSPRGTRRWPLPPERKWKNGAKKASRCRSTAATTLAMPSATSNVKGGMKVRPRRPTPVQAVHLVAGLLHPGFLPQRESGWCPTKLCRPGQHAAPTRARPSLPAAGSSGHLAARCGALDAGLGAALAVIHVVCTTLFCAPVANVRA